MLIAFALVALAGQDCSAFERRVAEPMSLSVSPIVSTALGGPAPPTPSPGARPAVAPAVAIGEFSYRGYGAAIRSSDPRFDAVVVRPGIGAWHPCGFAVDGPSSWNVFDTTRQGWTTTFRRSTGTALAPGATMAAEQGAAPVLAGFAAGATWPSFSGGKPFFIGLMHRQDGASRGQAETLIVAFASAPSPSPAKVMARLPLTIEAISIVPDLHGSSDFLNLEGRDQDGALNRIILEMSDETRKRYAAQFSAGPSPSPRFVPSPQ